MPKNSARISRLDDLVERRPQTVEPIFCAGQRDFFLLGCGYSFHVMASSQGDDRGAGRKKRRRSLLNATGKPAYPCSAGWLSLHRTRIILPVFLEEIAHLFGAVQTDDVILGRAGEWNRLD